MNGKRFKVRYFIPSIIIMIIIFCFSKQNGNDSGALSIAIVNVIRRIFPSFDNIDLLHLLIRKAAHMSEYALLAGSYYYGLSKNNITHTHIISIILCFIYACSDELHQLLVSGRAGRFIDVLIDTSGAIVMILLIIIVRRFYVQNNRN